MKFRRFAAAAVATATITAGMAAPASAQTELAALGTLFVGGKEAISQMDCTTSAQIHKAVGGTSEQTRSQYKATLDSKVEGLPLAALAKTLTGDVADKALECKQVQPDPAPANPIEALLRSSSESPILALLPVLSS